MNAKVARVADRLKEAMQRADMKPADLARVTGLERSSLSRYLSGQYEPKQIAIAKMAAALGVSEMWLFGYDVPMERTAAQKKNDDLVKVVALLRKDPEFFDVVTQLSELPADQYAGIKTIISALKNK